MRRSRSCEERSRSFEEMSRSFLRRSRSFTKRSRSFMKRSRSFTRNSRGSSQKFTGFPLKERKTGPAPANPVFKIQIVSFLVRFSMSFPYVCCLS